MRVTGYKPGPENRCSDVDPSINRVYLPGERKQNMKNAGVGLFENREQQGKEGGHGEGKRTGRRGKIRDMKRKRGK